MLEKLLAKANNKYDGKYPAGIACYNGPRSFTLAGSVKAMDVVAETISAAAEFESVKSKRLNVTNAFHSTLVEPLIPALEEIGHGLTFNEPIIKLERAIETRPATSKLTPMFVSDHMRNPVFFNHAVQRLAKDHPSCVWLEAGSASTITIMAHRALGSVPKMHFQALDLTSDKGMENLSDATIALWNAGLRFSFWPHHRMQTHEYTPLLLPPYQFEKSQHWLDFKPVELTFISQRQQQDLMPQKDVPVDLWTFAGYQDAAHHHARFRINADTQVFKSFISGHIAVQTAPICPATLQIDMAIEALRSLLPESESAQNLQPVVCDVQNHVALCVDPARLVWLDLETVEGSWRKCKWKIVTTGLDYEMTGKILCVEGRIELRPSEDAAYSAEFARFERLVSHQTCIDLLNDTASEADCILQGEEV